ncbi:MAG: amidohydrolase [Clostridiales bacterium]|nr:amidohydrolase [Clostridiales bacterium]
MPKDRISPVSEQALIAFFQDLHRHPELGLQEFRTTEKIRGALAEAGVETVDPGLGTGLIAVIRGQRPGRTIGLRADMDALPIQEESGLSYASLEPGKMHACGHDFHTACMVGAALLLKAREEELPGAVKIAFQPAEEISDGGKRMADTGLLNDCAEFYAGHAYPGFPAGTLGIKPGPVMAAPDAFTLRIIGKGAHAGNPHLGIDPIPAAAAFIQAAQTLLSREKDAFEPAVLSVTHVEAGSTWNVMPEEALIEGTLRTLNQDLRRRMHKRVRQMAEGVAQAHGCQASFSWMIGPDPVINDERLCREAARVAVQTGLNVDRQENTMGGEDFSEFLKIGPGVFVRVGTGGGYTNHHPRFTADPAALWPAANFFAELAMQRAGADL